MVVLEKLLNLDNTQYKNEMVTIEAHITKRLDKTYSIVERTTLHNVDIHQDADRRRKQSDRSSQGSTSSRCDFVKM